MPRAVANNEKRYSKSIQKVPKFHHGDAHRIKVFTKSRRFASQVPQAVTYGRYSQVIEPANIQRAQGVSTTQQKRSLGVNA